VRRIREVLRLRADDFSDRQIAAAMGSARSTVQECLRRRARPGGAGRESALYRRRVL
jgi:IS30 family transposase